MNKTILSLALGAMLLALTFPAESQQTKKIPRIGWLASGSASAEALRQELRAFGYVEGKNIAIQSRSAEGKLDRLPAVTDELVRLKVDVFLMASLLRSRACFSMVSPSRLFLAIRCSGLLLTINLNRPALPAVFFASLKRFMKTSTNLSSS